MKLVDVGKGHPAVRDVLQVDTRTIRCSLVNASRETSMGAVFLPDCLHIEYRNGVLSFVGLTGVRLRADGNPWVTAHTPVSKVFCQAGTGQTTLPDDTPDWVVELVRRFRP